MRGNLQGGCWPIENPWHLPSASWLSLLLHFPDQYMFLISCLKSHLFFNHVVNRTGRFFPHFHFYTSQLTIDLNLQSQKLFEHHPDATRGKFHILTSCDSLRYRCSDTAIQSHLEAVCQVCLKCKQNWVQLWLPCPAFSLFKCFKILNSLKSERTLGTSILEVKDTILKYNETDLFL